MFDAAGGLRNKCVLMTAYGAGLRVSEVAKLRVSDIDSGKMQIFIQVLRLLNYLVQDEGPSD